MKWITLNVYCYKVFIPEGYETKGTVEKIVKVKI